MLRDSSCCGGLHSRPIYHLDQVSSEESKSRNRQIADCLYFLSPTRHTLLHRSKLIITHGPFTACCWLRRLDTHSTILDSVYQYPKSLTSHHFALHQTPRSAPHSDYHHVHTSTSHLPQISRRGSGPIEASLRSGRRRQSGPLGLARRQA